MTKCVCPTCGKSHKDARVPKADKQAPARRREIIMAALAGEPMTSRELDAVTDMTWDQLHANVDILRRQGKIARRHDDRWVIR